MTRPIYLDYAATTPVDEKVVSVMQEYLGFNTKFGNPASTTHFYGIEAEEAVHEARASLANLIHCSPKEIVWTSGATESDNLALQGVMEFFKGKKSHLITVKTEHKAVLDTAKMLEDKGVKVTYLDVLPNGLIDLAALKAAITNETALVSVMHVNNELGVIQDLAAIGEICREHQAYFHVDAAQSLGKLTIDLQALPVDLMSFSGHKVYGPKGIGALYVRRKPKVRLTPLIFGGGHEGGFRSGTLATHQIVGFGKACECAAVTKPDELKRLRALRDALWQTLSEIPEIVCNTDFDNSVGNFLNVSFAGIDGEALLLALHKLAISAGSACDTTTIQPSHVLKALGLSDALAHATLRISLGRYTTEEDVNVAGKEIVTQVARLRKLSPLWSM